MKKLVVCVSGFGSNLQAIIDACKTKMIKAEIALVVSNKKDAYGITRAKNSGINTFVSSNIELIFSKIEEAKPDLIVLAGFMKLIPVQVVKKFENKIINIHPSLLPHFPGLNSIKRAYLKGVAETGVTVHYVDEGMDTGKIISQVKVPIKSEYTLEQLEEKIHEKEHQLYPEAICKLLNQDNP